jgi:hypothetical protein
VRGEGGVDEAREERVQVIKSVMEGGVCVYAQTGSMSNIVRPETSLVGTPGAVPQPVPGEVPHTIKGAHTPMLGARKDIMIVRHTPIISKHIGEPEYPVEVTTKSRAGFNDDIQQDIKAANIYNGPDLRKPSRYSRSPNYSGRLPSIAMNRSPAMLNGRLEGFGDISTMILKWEEEEGALDEKEGKVKEGGQGGRRRSQRIYDLCGLFEGGGERQENTALEDASLRVGGDVGGIFSFSYQNSRPGPKNETKKDFSEGGGGGKSEITTN